MNQRAFCLLFPLQMAKPVVVKGFLDVFRLRQGAWNSPTLRKGPFSLETGRSRNSAVAGQRGGLSQALTGLREEQHF